MGLLSVDATRPTGGLLRLPFYYGWITVTIAAFAMVATLPGRTQGLGLITEPLLRDLQIDRVLFAQINLWATLVGGLFCFGIGRLIDRLGSRTVLTSVALALGAVVVLMSTTRSLLPLAVLITLTRGLGQSALSVVSITIVGLWFVRRISLAMAVYTVVLSVGFMAAFPAVGAVVTASGWRPAWLGVGAALLLGLTPISAWLMRGRPEDVGLDLDGPPADRPETDTEIETEIEPQGDGHTLRQALSTAAFWIFSLGSAVYGLTASGIALFNESILAERGFPPETYHRSLAISALTALAGNFLGGWLAAKGSMSRLMALAMALLAASLLALPHVATEAHVAAYAVITGLAGGFVMVLFFSVWSRAFGRRELGRIQGAAQSLTVLASAIGPLLLAECVERTGSYASMFYLLAGVVALLGAGAWLVTVPGDQRRPASL